MINVKEVISLQSPKGMSRFIAHLKKRNKRSDVKNVALYKAYLNSEEQHILNEVGSNAFNALKKRLTDQLVDFVASEVLSKELSLENKVIKHLVLSRKLFSSGHIKSGFTFLRKAEKMALRFDHFSLLNEIYHTMIEYSHKVEGIDQNELFLKLIKNNEQFMVEEQLGVLFASMQKQFNSFSHGAIPPSLKEMFDDGFSSFKIKPEGILNFRSLNQLCVLSDLYASQTRTYHQLDLFFEKLIPQVQGTDKDSEKTLGYHIELLYGMANIYFRKKDRKKSLHYLNLMGAQMERYDSKYAALWNARHLNLMALNFNFSGDSLKGSTLLTAALSDGKLKEEDALLLKLTLAMIRFQQGELSTVRQVIKSIHKTDAWLLKHMGNEWVYNFKTMEVLLYIELEDDLLAASKVLSFQRKYRKHFEGDKFNPLPPFLELIKTVINYPDVLHTEEFVVQVESSIPWKGEEEDFFNICIYSWLKAKMKKAPLYETTLDLLNFKDHS